MIFSNDVRTDSNSNEHVIYDLVAVLYRGSSADSGHYVADVKALDGTWWNCNDQLIEKKNFTTSPGKVNAKAGTGECRTW